MMIRLIEKLGIFALAVAPPIVAGVLMDVIVHNILLAFLPALIVAHAWTRPMEDAYRRGVFDLYL